MNAHRQERRDYGFAIGLFTGTVVGAGLAMWFAPRIAAALRERVTDSARSFGERASEQYQQASTRVGKAVGDLTRKGQGARDDVAEAVASGARELERFAKAAKSRRGTDAGRTSAAADRAASKPRSGI